MQSFLICDQLKFDCNRCPIGTPDRNCVPSTSKSPLQGCVRGIASLLDKVDRLNIIA